MGEIRTRRWNDPIEPGDGWRILVCRYRPRGVSKEQETWNQWLPNLGPSRELHAKVYGKDGSLGLIWTVYQTAYLKEMRDQREAISSLAKQVMEGGDDHAALFVGLRAREPVSSKSAQTTN